MILRLLLSTGLLLGALTLPLAQLHAEAPFPPDQIEFFEKEVRPVLAENCYDCHNAHKHENGLRLDIYSAVLRGSDYGKVVEAGKPATSKLIKAINHAAGVEAMPKKGDKLQPAQIAALEKWVTLGMPWPQEKAAVATHEKTDPMQHWAYLPVKKPTSGNSVDELVSAKIKAAGLDFAPPADAATLCRRIYVTLTGLQPSYEQSQAFIRDPNAEKLITQLLSTPAYGERWARAWLDVARYADTDGYQVAGRNINYPYAYTYRDWVVKSLNEDMPYDQFLMHQLAADKMHPTEPNHASLAALGFLNVGDKFISDRNLQIDDRIDVVSRGMLGITVGCARCHNHKFDPIPTKDYYAMYSIFSSSTEPEQKDLPIIGKPANEKDYHEYEGKVAEIAKKELDFKKQVHDEIRKPERLAEYLAFAQEAATIKDKQTLKGRSGALKLRDKVADKWGDFLNRYALKGKPHPVMLAWKEFAKLPAAEFASKAPAVVAAITKPESGLNEVARNEFIKRPAPKTMEDVSKVYAEMFSTCLDGKEPDNKDWAQVREILLSDPSPMAVPMEQANLFFTRKDQDTIVKLSNERVKLESDHPGAPPRAMVSLDKPKPSDVRVFVRGNPGRQGEAAPRAWLTMFGGELFKDGSGRLELAQKIASKDNPLTARVIVNRVWTQHFGKPLVGQTSDFGVQSPKPEQAELLDFLAASLMENGWSLKKLHLMILSSRTWQQSSQSTDSKDLKDPENDLLTRYNRQRLDYESMRDAMLQASSSLTPDQQGGRPVRYSDKTADACRTVYMIVDRYDQATVPAMFDFANPDSHSQQRYVTTVPQQTLFLMNSPFIKERAALVAKQTPIQGSGIDSQTIQALYHRVLRRDATPDEVELAQRFAQDAGTLSRRSSAFVWKYGYGKIEKTAGDQVQLTSFTRMKNFGQTAQTKNRWYPTSTYPDKEYGHLQIGLGGGHPGSTWPTVMQWTSPFEKGRVRISGSVKRSSDKGNGVRAWIISNRKGRVVEQFIKPAGSAEMKAEIELEQDEILSFVVESENNDTNSDSYTWVPRIEHLNEDASLTLITQADTDFCGPDSWPLNRNKPQGALSQLAQVLMMSNEFQFVD
ncbi:MAG: PSD1 and planctomycete cytochrome C domain-containing protein [Verrucomicrobia bacterium]|nr:PSD1 and planctomycete cytochrome C domain-containing protein [Verrucomicrobiota bacterium]